MDKNKNTTAQFITMVTTLNQLTKDVIGENNRSHYKNISFHFIVIFLIWFDFFWPETLCTCNLCFFISNRGLKLYSNQRKGRNASFIMNFNKNEDLISNWWYLIKNIWILGISKNVVCNFLKSSRYWRKGWPQV